MTNVATMTDPEKRAGLYVLELGSGEVKVGRSTNLRDRLKTHARNANIYGGEIVRRWTCTSDNPALAETSLLQYLRQHYEQGSGGTENFVGLPFEEAVDLARAAVKKRLWWESWEIERRKEEARQNIAEVADKAHTARDAARGVTRHLSVPVLLVSAYLLWCVGSVVGMVVRDVALPGVVFLGSWYAVSAVMLSLVSTRWRYCWSVLGRYRYWAVLAFGTTVLAIGTTGGYSVLAAVLAWY